MQSVALWLKQANESKEPGGYLFEQLTSNNKDRSLYQLNQVSVGIAKVDSHKARISALIDASVNQRIKAYLNQAWQQQISTPFNRFFANRFPFSLSSDSEVNFKAFHRFFKISGQLSQFEKTFIDKFAKRDNQLLLVSFNGNTEIVIDAQQYQQLSYLLNIQESLYQQTPEQFNISFKAKILSMSAELLSFELFTQRSIFSYQHGPKLWTNFTWPDLSNQNDLLAIFTDTKNQKQTLTFAGQWAWLRLIYKYYQESGSSSQVKLVQGDNEVTLMLNVDGDYNPLAANFFSRIQLANQLL